MDRTYTVREVVEITTEMLKGIRVPAEYTEEIGLPVMNAIKNLRVVAQTMEQAEVAAEIQGEPAEQENGGKNG